MKNNYTLISLISLILLILVFNYKRYEEFLDLFNSKFLNSIKFKEI